jgi:hypothetical protein
VVSCKRYQMTILRDCTLGIQTNLDTIPLITNDDHVELIF